MVMAVAANLFRPLLISPLYSFAASNGIAIFPAWVLSRYEKRPMDVYGLTKRDALRKQFWLGWFAGLLEVSLLVGILKLLHAYSFGTPVLRKADLVRWSLFFLVLFFEKATFFQFLIRGYSQYTLGNTIGFWPAAEILSAFYVIGAMPSGRIDLVGLPIFFMVGLFWSFTLRRTGSLWFAVGMNASFDFGATFLYSMPNLGFGFPFGVHLSNPTVNGAAWLTGGTLGIEGSALRILTVGLLFSLLNKLCPRNASTAVTRSTAAAARTSSIPDQAPLG
jgi:uncharacterized protein